MPYRYNLPHTVLSPMKNVKNVRVLFDSGNFHGAYSIARLEWNNNEVLGIRWNINENEGSDPKKMSGAKICLGEPNSRGYSTWFILPDDFINRMFEDTDLTKKLKEYLKSK